jgi:hypothetical protein
LGNVWRVRGHTWSAELTTAGSQWSANRCLPFAGVGVLAEAPRGPRSRLRGVPCAAGAGVTGEPGVAGLYAA